MKKLLLLFFFMTSPLLAVTDFESPPFEVTDPATTENFRNIYYNVDKLSLLTTPFAYDATTNIFCIDNPTFCVDGNNNAVAMTSATVSNLTASTMTVGQQLLLPDGTQSSLAIAFGADSDLGLYRIGANNPGWVYTTWDSFRAVTGSGSNLMRFNKSRGDVSSSTIVVSGDNFMLLDGRGYDGAAFQNACRIEFSADTTVSPGNMPGRITFATTPSGSTTLVDALRIDRNQQLRAVDGTPSNPTYSYISDADTGRGRSAANTMIDWAGGVPIATYTTSGVSIIGTNSTDLASPGWVGEIISSCTLAATNFPATTTWGDLVSIPLTAGDWGVSVRYQATANGATVTNIEIGISATSGNSASGLTVGNNRLSYLPPVAASDTSAVIPPIRVSLSGASTRYLKFKGTFSVATPQAQGCIDARRIR